MRDPSSWLALLTLAAMEIVLGIDNIVFVALLSSKLPPPQGVRARRVGLGLSLVFRLCLLAGAAYAIRLTAPVFAVFEQSFSWRDLILIAGGFFLVFKATAEIHHSVDQGRRKSGTPKPRSFAAAAAQIVFLDLIFSIDSIITAVGMTEHIPIMFAAVVIAVAAMLAASGPLASFMQRNPTIVMLALGFLLLIGATLIADGFGYHFPKGYIYTAMAFSAAVEGLNMLARRSRLPEPPEERSAEPKSRAAAKQPPARRRRRRPPG
ncbi:MAG TPA: TerC family protein [Methylocella sp.]|nr:TerC family protein [Methylocella sp.]